MAETEMRMIVKIIGIIAVILCGISLIVPWVGADYNGYGENVYTWGGSYYSPHTSEWDIFFLETLSSSANYGIEENFIFIFCMILAFVFTLIALFFGIYGIIKINTETNNILLVAGIFGIIAMILPIVGLSQLGTTRANYGAGFFLIISTFILYIVAFSIQKMIWYFPQTPGRHTMYQQPQYGQPQMMYYTQHPPQSIQSPPQPQTTPTYCPECGTLSKPGYQFCYKCGTIFQ